MKTALAGIKKREMKQLKDYINFYLGCYGLMPDGTRVYIQGVYDFEANRYVKYLVQDMHSDLNGVDGSYIVDNIKLLLLPLSSMTEAQAIEMVALTEYEPHFNDVRVEHTKYNDLVVSWQGARQSREQFNATGDVFYCHEQFTWLLKNHFDIFELIDAGLALDATQQPTTA